MEAKVGAREVTGIEIDERAYNNEMENISDNGINSISIKIGDASLLENEQSFDVILANINRNILLNDMPFYVGKLNENGQLIMSGFYTQDIPLIREKAESLGLTYQNFKEDNNWVSVTFYKK
mgnify:CR=1 FL=1